jgi:hypothetical protein
MVKQTTCGVLCEAKRTVAVETSVKSDDPNYPFRVCKDVAKRLKACALTPLEWYRLAAIHHPQDFLLHEDFYDDEGNAMQPGMRVPKRPKERPPVFDEVQDDMEELLDYFFSRRQENEKNKILQALARFDKDELFEVVERRLGNPPRKAIEGDAYLIFQRVLPKGLAPKLERKWQAIKEDQFGDLGAIGELAAASVRAVGVAPTMRYIRQTVERLRWPDETKKHAPVYYGLPGSVVFYLGSLIPAGLLVSLVLELMDKLPRKQRASDVLHALSHLRDERVLDWIEKNAVPPTTYEWGTAVACNKPGWKRLAKWLDRGRPLSLIALDALRNCCGYDAETMSGIFRNFTPKVHGPVSLKSVRKKLEEYQRKDSAPRVEKAMGVVLENLEKIFAEFTS